METAAAKTEGVDSASVNFIMQKITVEFKEGYEPDEVMKDVLKNCKKIESDCEIYF